MPIRPRGRNRSGNLLVLSAFLMAALCGLLAFAVDMGYLHVIRSELQATADAAAMAAAWDLIDEGVLSGAADPYGAIDECRLRADRYADLHTVGGVAPTLSYEDVEVGQISDPSNPYATMSFDDPSRFNAVRVRVKRNDDLNGEIALFFARVLGFGSSAQEAEATALFLANLSGFTIPSSGRNLNLMPFALDMETWNALVARTTGEDNFSYDSATGTVSSGSDGILEVNLFPQDTGSPGNRGTVDIGNNNNAVPDIRRQILYGISPEDLEQHGGSLEFDENGQFFLNGDTGISAGVKGQLEQVVGLPRIILLFTEVVGNGDNTTYTIEGFAGVRIVEVSLTGSSKTAKRVMIQPADVQAEGMIVPSDPTQKSYFVYSSVYLIR